MDQLYSCSSRALGGATRGVAGPSTDPTSDGIEVGAPARRARVGAFGATPWWSYPQAARSLSCPATVAPQVRKDDDDEP